MAWSAAISWIVLLLLIASMKTLAFNSGLPMTWLLHHRLHLQTAGSFYCHDIAPDL